jgi:hypothetical protein
MSLIMTECRHRVNSGRRSEPPGERLDGNRSS